MARETYIKIVFLLFHIGLVFFHPQTPFDHDRHLHPILPNHVQ